jgi:hypothetical protein
MMIATPTVIALALSVLSSAIALVALLRTGRQLREAERDQLLRALNEDAVTHRVTAEENIVLQRVITSLPTGLRRIYEPEARRFEEQALKMASESEAIGKRAREYRRLKPSELRSMRREFESKKALAASIIEQHNQFQRMVLKSLESELSRGEKSIVEELAPTERPSEVVRS